MTILTREEREAQVLLSRTLGPIFPLYGIVDPSPGVLTCECGAPNCRDSGKHPRWKNYRQRATTDPDRIRRWLARFPHANFGVVTGSLAIALDVDVRPDENGLLTLDYVEIDCGKRLPYTVEVLTGRNNGSRHYYFRPPTHVAVRTRAKALPGWDIRAGGAYCVAAGSRHATGGYYRFAEECAPDEQALADLPDFILTALAESGSRAVILEPEKPYSESQPGFDLYLCPDSPPLPDGVVLGVMRRDPVARFYLQGGRRNRTPSEDDFALACKLAFYCRHDLEQMYRLFMKSGLHRSKFEEPRPGGNYALWTLRQAIRATPETWIRKKRQRPSTATGAKKGRKVSPDTTAILELRRTHPHLTAAAIADRLGLKPRQVRDAIYYHGHHLTKNACQLIHKKGNQQVDKCSPGLELESDAA